MQRTLFYMFCAFASLAAAGDAFPPHTTWRLHHRLQVGWECDSNVFEALNDPHAGQDLRLLYEIKAAASRVAGRYQFGYRSGGQFYPDKARENKLIQEIEAGGECALTPALALGGSGYGRLKLFLQRDEDYAFGRAQLYLALRLPARFTIKGGFSGEGLDYSTAGFYDYAAPGLFCQLHRPISNHIAVTGRASLLTLHYRRVLYRLVSRNEAYPSQDAHQEDDLAMWGLRVDVNWCGFLGQIGYRREESRSNSPGYDYSRDVIEVSMVQQLYGWYLRGLLTLQQKRYRDDLYPFWPLQPDAELEESNVLVIDLSRPLMTRIEMILRAAWYRNESPWAALFYSKRLLSLNLEYQF
ncbi:MAG TPA: hypothetical protein PLG50_03310 [bacterium]|nr:hypothetical protein [bacterium]HQG44670.1 hypothetical protein [bacterium]HQI49446.1 hypothetical protein [bacterium]HQJ63500.1 hypothetical protein [bacterium]